MAKVSMTDIMEMTVSERILLAQDLWDSITAAPESIDLTEAQREELDRRLAGFDRDPDTGVPWAEVRASLAKES